VAGTYELLFGGQPADDAIRGAITSLEVEENLDLPDAIQLRLSVNRTADGELDYVTDERLQPFSNIAVVATPDGGPSECIFDGFVLSHRIHLDSAIAASTLEVWGQDASWLMNLEEKVREWVDVTDGQVANSIFGDYGFDPSGGNTDDDSPSHTEDGHSLMQRGTDIAFLRSLARRNGKICRVACADTPGARTGFFTSAAVDGDPVVTIVLNDPVERTVDSLEFGWDAARPTKVKASQATFDDDAPEGVSGDADESGLAALGDRDLATFAGRSMTVMLSTPVDDGGELELRSQSLVREASWFARCEGDAEASRLGRVLRVNTIVQLDGLGSLLSGKYLVWSVRHTITASAHRMHFVLSRNAVGPAPSGGSFAGALSSLP
jgi:phage protein D